MFIAYCKWKFHFLLILQETKKGKERHDPRSIVFSKRKYYLNAKLSPRNFLIMSDLRNLRLPNTKGDSIRGFPWPEFGFKSSFFHEFLTLYCFLL